MTGKQDEALAAYKQARAISERLALEYPAVTKYQRDSARDHHNVGGQLSLMGQRAEALDAFEKALTIYERLVREHPTVTDYQGALAQDHLVRGGLFNKNGEKDKALVAYGQARTILERLVRDHPTVPEFQSNLARCLNSIGNWLTNLGKPDEALAAYQQAREIQERQARDFPDQPDLRNSVAGTLVNTANIELLRKDFAGAMAYLVEARPHHEAALEVNSRHPQYRQFFSNNLWGQAQANAGLLDQSLAMRAAESIRDLGWDPPGNAFTSACALADCIPIVAVHEKLDQPQRDVAAAFYADHAVKMLRDATNKGFNDANRIKRDPILAPLRDHEDFKRLVNELEAKAHAN
jgi:tetratricopeptide (TPR) repeat protein